MNLTTKHKLDFCGACGVMIRCGTCGNNCCNAGYGSNNGNQSGGTLEDHCQDCPDAYEVQAAYMADKKSYTFDFGTDEDLLDVLDLVMKAQGDAAPWLTEVIRRGLEVPPGRYWINDTPRRGE